MINIYIYIYIAETKLYSILLNCTSHLNTFRGYYVGQWNKLMHSPSSIDLHDRHGQFEQFQRYLRRSHLKNV